MAQAGDGGVFDAVVQNFVVDLIGKNDQAMGSGNVNDAPENVIAVQSAGGVVGVDDHNALGLGRDFGTNVSQIGGPALRLLAHIVHGRGTRHAGRGRPQGIVGGWQK